MRIAICDDNTLFLKQFEKQLLSFKQVTVVHTFSKLEDFLHSANNENKYDVVLMDIDWNHEKTGIDAAEELFQVSPNTKVIYVTGYTERYVQQTFLRKANVSGFLTKPINNVLLGANLDKVVQSLKVEEDVLTVKVHSSHISIPQKDIFFLESRDHTVLIYTRTETISVYERLKNIAEKLPASFIQCHKSFVVNMHEIQRFQANSILLKSGMIIPVSRSHYAETKTAFFTFMGKEL